MKTCVFAHYIICSESTLAKNNKTSTFKYDICHVLFNFTPLQKLGMSMYKQFCVNHFKSFYFFISKQFLTILRVFMNSPMTILEC